MRRLVDDPCTVDEDCNPVIPNAECTTGTCQCRDRYRASDDRHVCYIREYNRHEDFSPIVGTRFVLAIEIFKKQSLN